MGRGRRSGRLTETINLRLTNEEREFLEMISRKADLTLSEAARLAINMLRIILGLEAVDIERVSAGFKPLLNKHLKKLLAEEE